MTDYRMRNHDLLYDGRGRRPLTWRDAAVFGAIAATVAFGVATYLTDRFNAATAGFNPASRNLIAQQAETAGPLVQLARPEARGSGS